MPALVDLMRKRDSGDIVLAVRMGHDDLDDVFCPREFFIYKHYNNYDNSNNNLNNSSNNN
jgi:hypothetical protein